MRFASCPRAVVVAAVLCWASALCGAAPAPAPALAKQKDEKPWPVPIVGHVPVKPGEHPRLFFRVTDLPELRKRAQTPEGKEIIKRLRSLLNGSDGETMPTTFNPERGPLTEDGAQPRYEVRPGTYTFSHTAGYGFLYLLTGEKKYADMGRKCMELALEGCRDRDRRYSLRYPHGALRAGPSLGWTAVGYDLCYDGWDEEFRKRVAKELSDYDVQGVTSIGGLAVGSTHHPGSNHWGMQVGGGALAILALMNDPGVDNKKILDLLEGSKKAMIRNMTQGFGDHGWFREGCGTGSMSSYIAFLPALQAWRVAGGMDFVSPQPNGQWLVLKWHLLTVWDNHKPIYPPRGMYPHNIWAREGISGAGYFAEGFGVLNDEQKSAMLWIYNEWVKAGDEKAGTPFDTTTPYPHNTILSFVNFPFGMEARNPVGIIPRAVGDDNTFYMFRNRWQDRDDIALSIQTRDTKGFGSSQTEGKAVIHGLGRDMEWGTMKAEIACFRGAKDGSGFITGVDGTCFAVDFSKASGADAMFVMTGTNLPPGTVVTAGDTAFSFCFLSSGAAPVPRADGNKVVVGKQTICLGESGIEFGVMDAIVEKNFRDKAFEQYRLGRKMIDDLAKAKALIKSGDTTTARALLAEIVKQTTFPQAVEAQKLLLDNTPMEEM